MSSTVLVLLIAMTGITMPYLIDNAFGHGLGGDVAPPISFEGMNVTVSTQIDPYDLTVGEIDSVNMAIRFYDTITNNTLQDVTYRAEVHKSGVLLARDLFFDTDGTLNLDIRPKSDCTKADLWRCTVIAGSEHPSSPGAKYVHGNGRPTVTGPIFDKGGLYNIRVDIEGATSPKVLLVERLTYDTFISVAQEQNFIIDAFAQNIPVSVKTYYDDVGNFAFDKNTNSISFDMSFNWDPQYTSLVPIVHEEIRVPKSFAPYGADKQFKGYVNGIQVDSSVLLLDPYSTLFPDSNILHFLITNSELDRISKLLVSSGVDSSVMSFELVPHDGVDKNSINFHLVDSDTENRVGSSVSISWDKNYDQSNDIPFEFTFFDENKNLLKDVSYAYSVTDSDNIITLFGTESDSLGISASEGIDIQKIKIAKKGIYKIDLVVLGTGISNDPTYSGIGSGLVEIGSATPKETDFTPKVTITIPSWVKDNAGWWAEGKITDADFVAGIEYLIKQGVIMIEASSKSVTTPDSLIPDWVRNNAGWWAEGKITDTDFVSGIQFLIENGIISI